MGRTRKDEQDTIRENIERYEEQHLDVPFFTKQAGDRKHEDIIEAIELFGTRVLPEFKDRHETNRRKWHEERLASVEFPTKSSI